MAYHIGPVEIGTPIVEQPLTKELKDLVGTFPMPVPPGGQPIEGIVKAVKRADFADFNVITKEGNRVAREISKLQVYLIQYLMNDQTELAYARITYDMINRLGSVGWTPRTHLQLRDDKSLFDDLDAKGGGNYLNVVLHSPTDLQNMADEAFVLATKAVFMMGADEVA